VPLDTDDGPLVGAEFARSELEGGVVEARTLGPLELWAGERQIEIGGGRQRALLALLILNRNEVVSSDRLIDELWGETPPPTAAKALHVLVSQLRRAIDSGDVLVTRAPGYALRLDRGSLDTDRFETLLAEGRRALASGDPESAAGTLRDALGLWRGAALAEFAFDPFAQSEIRRLEELRLEAIEERIEADLALGERLVGELEELVAAHPLRERLRGQLMIALYRAGRQADALDVYREGRRLLVEELGIEPRPALQGLEKAILTQDPALEPPPPRPPASQPGGPTAAPPGSPPPARRRRAAWLAAGALAAVAAAVAVPLLLAGGEEPLVIVPDSLVRIDPETNEIAEVVPVGRWPDQVAAAGPYVFVVNADDGTITRVDPRSEETRTFSAVSNPIGLAVQDDRKLWIGSNTTPEAARVDAESTRVDRRLTFEGRSAVWLAAGGGYLWVTHTPVGSTSRGLEPISQVALAGDGIERHGTGNTPSGVAFGEGAAWVLNYGDSTVTRIQPQDGSTTQFDVGHQVGAIAVGFGSVWVTSDTDDAVWRVNPQTGRTQAVVPVGERPWAIAAGGGSVWVTSDLGGTIARIDPETNRVVATIRTGHHPHGIAVAPDGVWVAVSGETISSLGLR
jgi:YVTN family beta-propeller protein